MKILITGIPGTGKTSIGDYMQSEMGFAHFDIEAILKKHGNAGSEIVEEFINSYGGNKIITWGFIPKTDEGLVRKLQSLGYKMIWFDGNRDSARREFMKRGDVPENLFDLQLSKIDDMDLDIFKPARINTFDERGAFLSKKDIARLILENCD